MAHLFMSHAPHLVELRMAADQAELMAIHFLARHNGKAPTLEDCEDHRIEVLGNLLTALNRVEENLGDRIQQAMYPGLELGE